MAQLKSFQVENANLISNFEIIKSTNQKQEEYIKKLKKLIKSLKFAVILVISI